MTESPLTNFIEEFNSILQQVSPIWRTEILSQYKRPGRRFARSRIIEMLEPLLAKAIPPTKERSLSQEAVMCLVDATEESIERLRRDQHTIYVSKSRTYLFMTFRNILRKHFLLLSIHESSLIRDSLLKARNDCKKRRAWLLTNKDKEHSKALSRSIDCC